MKKTLKYPLGFYMNKNENNSQGGLNNSQFWVGLGGAQVQVVPTPKTVGGGLWLSEAHTINHKPLTTLNPKP